MSADIDTKSLRDLLSRATAGEWQADAEEVAATADPGDGGDIVCERPNPEDFPASASRWQANAALIAAAKNSMGALLDAYEERERLRDALRTAEHTLTFLNGCIATDRPDLFDTDAHKNVCWEIDADNELAEIAAALKEPSNA